MCTTTVLCNDFCFRFYWFINVGSLIAYTAVAYVQQNISFAWGFLVPLASMVLAVILFIVAKPFYVEKPPGGKPWLFSHP